jgi:hypothetical protein
MELQTLFKREGTADSVHKQQVRIILLYPNNSGVPFIPQIKNIRGKDEHRYMESADLKMAG